MADPITKAYFTSLNEMTKELMLDSAKGGVMDLTSAEKTSMQYANRCGVIEGLQTALNIEVPDA